MTKAVTLDNIQHKDLRVITSRGAAFGDAVNEVPIVVTEFADVSREYPIYFRRSDQGLFQAFALLGLDANENLYIEGDRWNARYVPAMLDRGPFMIGLKDPAASEAAEPVMMIDLEHPRVSETEGDALFLPQGGKSNRLERYLRTLQTIHRGMELNNAMFNALIEAKLLAPVEMTLRIDSTAEYTFEGLFSISQDGLKELDGPTLEKLNRSGLLAIIFQVLSSMGNMAHIITLKNARRAKS